MEWSLITNHPPIPPFPTIFSTSHAAKLQKGMGQPYQLHGKSMENPWKSMKIHENPWKSMKIHENPWFPRLRKASQWLPVGSKDGWPYWSHFGQVSVSIRAAVHGFAGLLGDLFYQWNLATAARTRNCCWQVSRLNVYIYITYYILYIYIYTLNVNNCGIFALVHSQTNPCAARTGLSAKPILQSFTRPLSSGTGTAPWREQGSLLSLHDHYH